MPQYTAYDNPNRATRKAYPYLLEIQSNLLDDLRTTVVIPLCPKAAVNGPISRLCQIVRISGKDFILLTQQIAAIDRNGLGKAVADWSRYRAQIVAALDFLISGI